MSADPFVPNPVDLSQPSQPSSVNPDLSGPGPKSFKPTGNLFKFKKGLLIALVLALILPISVYLVANYKTVFRQKAACLDTSYGVKVDSSRTISNTPPNGPGSNGPWTDGIVWIDGYAYNCSSEPKSLYLYRGWCPVWTGRNSSTYNCSENIALQEQPITIPAGTAPENGIHFKVWQPVGRAATSNPNEPGTCGAAQVDYQFTPEFDPNLTDAQNPGGRIQWGIFGALQQDCTSPLSCTSLTTTNATTVTSADKTKNFTINVAGGVAPYHVTWSSSLPDGQSGYSTGTFSPATCDIATLDGNCSTTWTAPAGEPVANHSWIVSASITDSANGSLTAQTSGVCAKTLTTNINQTLSCSGIVVSPNSSVITLGSDTRTLTPTITGGNTPYKITWTQTGGTVAPGATKDSGVWSPPSPLPTTTTSWTVTASIEDTVPTGGTPQTTTCNTTFSYTPPNTYSYRTCENNTCATKPCSPVTTDCSSTQSTCTSDSQCAQTYKHNVCEGNSCKSVDCNPKTTSCSTSSDCKSDSDCTTTQTHKECRNNACVSVTGPGSNTCSSDSNCTTPTPPPIPTSGTTDITILGIGAGTILTILGVMLAL